MIILELPSHSELLYAEIKRVLRIAADQGFSIPEFASRTTDSLSISIHLPSRLVRCCIDIPDENLDRVVNSDCDALYVIQYMESTRQHVSLKLHNHIHASIQLFSCIEQDEVCEYWYTPEGEQALTSRISLIHEIEFFKLSHSSWFIALLLLDFPLEDALLVARAATNVSRETWPTQISFFPMLSSSEKEQEDDKESFYPIDSTMMSLYPVVDDVKWIEKLLQLGIKTVQLRIKDRLQIDLESQITAAINLGHHYQAQVFINDYWQLAIKHGAYGVHLGQDDVISADLLAIKASGLRLGLSTHGYWEIINVEQLNPSYIALGHIFPTTTKQMPSQPQGLVRLGLYQQLVNSMPETTQGRMPTVAIGGIDLSNAQAVLNQGVSSLAVVRALTQANDLQQVIQDFNRIFESVGLSHAQEEVSHAYIA